MKAIEQRTASNRIASVPHMLTPENKSIGSPSRSDPIETDMTSPIPTANKIGNIILAYGIHFQGFQGDLPIRLHKKKYGIKHARITQTACIMLGRLSRLSTHGE